MKRLRNLLLATTSVFLFSQVHAGDIVPVRDELPWPWGTECPFPWSSVEGLWMGVEGSASGAEGTTAAYFDFSVVSTTDQGMRIVEVKHLDADFRLLAVGRGMAAQEARIVRAALYPSTDLPQREGYSVIIRSYIKELTKQSCSRDQQVTVLTIRSLSDKEKPEEIHYILEKVNTRNAL